VICGTGETQLYRLGAVGDRAAANRHDQVGPGLARHGGGLDHGMTGRVRRHVIEQVGKPVAECAAHLGNLVGRPVQRAADHQEDPLRVAPSRLLGDRLGGGLAEYHRFHRAKRDAPRLEHSFLH
jgi:hypothetical protein